jgi:cytochrome oxidase Cu insertion factor (SCO1/SenC/PrrC family)
VIVRHRSHTISEHQKERPMRSNVLIAVLGGAIVIAALAAAYIVPRSAETAPTAADDDIPLTDPGPYADFSVPDFALTNQRGEIVTRSDVIGDGEHYVIMDFFFSNCVLVCPLMNANMSLAQQRLVGHDVRMLSFSVDPVNDTPESLAEHAANLNADTDRWTFLTGEEGEVANIVAALGFAHIAPDPDDANVIQIGDGKTMRNIIHPSRFLVLDPQGRIVGSYRGTNRDEAAQMVIDLKRVLAMRPND